MREALAKQKLAAFERLQPEFEASFHFVQDVHGQRRFAAFPVTETVHYLHSLWICACKDRLLSVSKDTERYEGRTCLDLLRGWQEGETASLIAFLQRRLDGLPFADLTRQIQEATTLLPVDEHLVQYLTYGRLVLLNRGMNLMRAIDAIFLLPMHDLMREVQVACAQAGHRLDQIDQQVAELDDPLYSYVPHQLLAQQNMLVMNSVGVHGMTQLAGLPEARSWNIVMPADPLRPFAEHVIKGYVEVASS